MNIAVKVKTFFEWKHRVVNFSVQKCEGAKVSYKTVIFERTLLQCLRYVVIVKELYIRTYISANNTYDIRTYKCADIIQRYPHLRNCEQI